MTWVPFQKILPPGMWYGLHVLLAADTEMPRLLLTGLLCLVLLRSCRAICAR